MGDRGNIAVIQDDKREEQVWLYLHWGGYSMPALLQQGIKAGKERYNNPPYLTKILFGHAVPPDNWQSETGVGISTSIGDNEHPILVVDIPGRRVFTMPQEKLNDKGQVPADYKPDKKACWTFEEYADLKKLPWSE